MEQYQEFLRRIRNEGIEHSDRTGVGTISIFGHQMRFDLARGFPLVTTKKLHVRSIIYELLWFLNGGTNVDYLNVHGVSIWDEWAGPDGELGPIYGKQWRSWTAADGRVIDQIAWLVGEIRRNPNSRRLLVSAWNVGDLPQMALVPCHVIWQVSVMKDKLHLHLYQRSADAFLGVPFNIASYAILLRMLAQQTDLQAGDLVWSGGDCHIYKNHLEQVNLQLTRTPYPSPSLLIHRRPESIFAYKFEDFEVAGYRSHPHLHGDVAV